eukprot:gene35638-43224_t
MGDPLPRFVLRGHADAVNCVDFILPEQLVSGSGDGNVKVWNLDTQRAVASKAAHAASVISVKALSSTEFATSGRDGVIKIWNNELMSTDSDPHVTIETGSQHFCNIDCLYDEGAQVLASCDENSAALVWDARSPQHPSVRFLPPSGPSSTATTRGVGMLTTLLIRRLGGGGEGLGGVHVVGGYEDGSLAVYDLRTQRCLNNVAVHSDPVFALAHLPHPHPTPSIVSGGGGQQVIFTPMSTLLGLATDSNQPAQPQSALSLPWGATNALAVRHDSKVVAIGGGDTHLVDSRKTRFLATLRFHRENVGGLAYPRALLGSNGVGVGVAGGVEVEDGDGSSKGLAADGRETWLAVGARDGNISVWDLYPHEKK